MTVAGTTVTLEFTNVAAGVPVVVNIQTNGDPTSIFVSYGATENRLPATQNTDYALAIALDLLTFTVTPTASLMTKIAADGHNAIYVSRVVNLTSDFDQDDAFVREKLVSEFNEVWMAMQQVTKATGSVGDASQSAAQAAASAGDAAASEANVEADRVAAAASAAAAAVSETNALNSQTTAVSAALVANNKATEAAASAAAAANSVLAIGDPATIARYNVSNPWSAPQTFNAAVTMNAGGVLGDAGGDTVTIKGTLINANISPLWGSATIYAYGSTIADNMLVGKAAAGGDVILFRQQHSGFTWGYTSVTGLISAGLLGLPNIG